MSEKRRKSPELIAAERWLNQRTYQAERDDVYALLADAAEYHAAEARAESAALIDRARRLLNESFVAPTEQGNARTLEQLVDIACGHHHRHHQEDRERFGALARAREKLLAESAARIAELEARVAELGGVEIKRAAWEGALQEIGAKSARIAELEARAEALEAALLDVLNSRDSTDTWEGAERFGKAVTRAIAVLYQVPPRGGCPAGEEG